jgi:hypothetical protein
MAADPKSSISSDLTASTESRIEVLAPVAIERFDDYAIVGKLGGPSSRWSTSTARRATAC